MYFFSKFLLHILYCISESILAREKGIEHRLGERCELKRAGQPAEVAAAIAFLASSDASYITGQALPVDGGNTASLNMPGMKV